MLVSIFIPEHGGEGFVRVESEDLVERRELRYVTPRGDPRGDPHFFALDHLAHGIASAYEAILRSAERDDSPLAPHLLSLHAAMTEVTPITKGER